MKRYFLVREFEWADTERVSSDYYFDESAQEKYGPQDGLSVREGHDGVYEAVVFYPKKGGVIATVPGDGSYPRRIEILKKEEISSPPRGEQYIRLWSSLDDELWIDVNRLLAKIEFDASRRRFKLEQEIFELRKKLENK